MSTRRVLVVGLGRFGTTIVENLYGGGLDVIAIDERPEPVDAVKARTAVAVVGDATNARALSELGAAEVDSAIVTFGEDFEASVLVVATLRDLGVKTILARAATPRQSEILLRVGATRVVQLEAEMGRRIAQDLSGKA